MVFRDLLSALQRLEEQASKSEERVSRDVVESPYLKASDNIRAAARWLVAAFAAVGGVLVAGVPLTDIGRIKPWSTDFFWATGGLAVALAAIAYMIYTTSRVFTDRFVSFNEFIGGDRPRRSHPAHTPTIRPSRVAASSCGISRQRWTQAARNSTGVMRATWGT